MSDFKIFSIFLIFINGIILLIKKVGARVGQVSDECWVCVKVQILSLLHKNQTPPPPPSLPYKAKIVTTPVFVTSYKDTRHLFLVLTLMYCLPVKIG